MRISQLIVGVGAISGLASIKRSASENYICLCTGEPIDPFGLCLAHLCAIFRAILSEARWWVCLKLSESITSMKSTCLVKTELFPLRQDSEWKSLTNLY